MSYESQGSFRRRYLAILGGAAVIAVVGTVFAGLLSTESVAAPTVAPSNVTEPRVTGTTRVGQVLRTTRGEWDGTAPIQYQYRWFRCEGAGAADASDCNRISNASNASYSLRQADAGFRIRSQVVARNEDGPGHRDVEPDERRHRGQAGEHHRAVDHGDGAGRQSTRGQPRPVGRRRADHLLVRLAPLQRQGRQLQ